MAVDLKTVSTSVWTQTKGYKMLQKQNLSSRSELSLSQVGLEESERKERDKTDMCVAMI